EPRRSRWRLARAQPFPTHRAADCAALDPRASGWRQAVLQLQRALHLLRHHPPRARIQGPRRRRKRRFRHPLPLRPALPLRDLDRAATPRSLLRAILASELREPRQGHKSLLTRTDQVLDYPAYNLVLQSAPLRESHLESFHWHIEYMPRLTRIAGFEWGTGFYINP